MCPGENVTYASEQSQRARVMRVERWSLEAGSVFQPVYFNLLLQRLELRITGEKFRFLLFCEGRGESIGQTDFEARFEIRSEIGGWRSVGAASHGWICNGG